MLSYPVRIVLVEPSHPGNIGASARAMKNMGLSDLYLVKPKHFPHPQAVELAAGAEDILMQAKVVASLHAALADCQCVWMSSARTRHIGIPQVTPEEAAAIYQTRHSTASLAMVFGRERSGLTNEELLCGHYHVYIPSNPAYASLNLAQAVLMVTYAWRRLTIEPTSTPKADLATQDALAQFYQHLFSVLEKIGFLQENAPKKLKARLRRLFSRTMLESSEVNLLRGILNRVEYTLELTKNKADKHVLF